ncbi:MAG: hypothetical protein INQ03_01625 [Candidatus Heimdallarchaeota archaeon]|nr:hypothetical protein [Candidatus Heimdallarchaeota archaeon]
MQQEFVLSRQWDRFSSSLVFAHLIEELGEIASYILYKEKYKVEKAGHKENLDKKNLEQEFAQAFNLFLQLANSAEVNLEEVWKEEYERNHERFDKEIWRKLAEED